MIPTNQHPPRCLATSGIAILEYVCIWLYIYNTPYLFPIGCFTKHFIEKIGYRMVIRQRAYRQQVGTLYEMTSPSSLWNASPQTTRVQKHVARHRATTQSFRLSPTARARWRDPDSTNASEPRFQPEVWRQNEKWCNGRKSVGEMMQNEKSCFCTIVKC